MGRRSSESLRNFSEGITGLLYQRNLLNKVIRPNDIANAVFALLAILDKSTGNIINVDGGVPDAFVR